MTVRKIALGTGIAVAALALVTGIALWRIDPNDYVGLVNAKVKESTGRELKIEGKIGYSLSLRPTVAVEGIRFQNAPWGSRPDMVTAKRIEVQIALLPLLGGNVEVRGLTLIEPDVLLEVDPKGARNWEFHTDGAKPKPDTGGDGAMPPIEIRRARVENAVVVYREAKSKQETRLVLEQLTLGGSSDRIEIDGQGRLNSVALQIEGRIDHAGKLGAVGATGNAKVTLTSPGIKLLATGSVPLGAGGLNGLDVGFTAAISDWVALGKLTQSSPPTLPPLKAEAKARVKSDVLSVEELQASLGKSSFSGNVRIGLGEKRRDIEAQLQSPWVDLAELQGPPQASRAQPDGRMFSSEPFALDGIKALNGKANLRITRLALRDGKVFDGVEAQASFNNGKVSADPVRIKIDGKDLGMRISADASSGKTLAINLAIDGQGISLGALGALLNLTGTPEGSPTDISVRFSGAGNSVRALVAGGSGDVRIVVGPGRIKNRAISWGADVTELLNAINPARAADPYTELKCAVIRLPIRQGVARVDNSIAAETAKVNIIVAGVIDLRNETLDLGIRPKAATGLGVDLGGLARLGRLRGTFAHPAVELDLGSAASAASQIGLATITGGLSMLAGGLLTERVPDHPCQAALTGTARSQQKAPAGTDQPSFGSSIIEGIKKLFSP